MLRSIVWSAAVKGTVVVVSCIGAVALIVSCRISVNHCYVRTHAMPPKEGDIRRRVASLEQRMRDLGDVKLFQCSTGVAEMSKRLDATFDQVQDMCEKYETSFNERIFSAREFEKNFGCKTNAMLIHQATMIKSMQDSVKEVTDTLERETERAKNHRTFTQEAQKLIAEQLKEVQTCLKKARQEGVKLTEVKALSESVQSLEEAMEDMECRVQSLQRAQASAGVRSPRRARDH